MHVVQKIIFPYLLEHSPEARTAVFFGTDFYNLPIGTDQALFIKQTNAMLAYIRKNLPEHTLLYQPHPNETDEYTKLDLAGNGFTVGKRTIADYLLFHGAHDIEWIFASCSWAAASSYAMGYRAAVFLDLMKGSVPDETIEGYRSYFHGLPESFFIRSFDAPLPDSHRTDIEDEEKTMEAISKEVGNPETLWFIASDPAYVMRDAIIVNNLRKKRPIKTGLLMIEHNRWDLVKDDPLLKAFDTMIPVPRVWYSARPMRVLNTLLATFPLSRLPIQKGDTLVSFAHTQFSENCVLSWYQTKKILMTENRWYYFTYENPRGGLPEKDFHGSLGLTVFNTFVEPLLRLFRSEYLEYKDGKVVNIVRYRKPLEEVYDAVFVLMPPK
ncbi:MAG: hypothetical protein Q7S50_04020 [bacterium]|nr:hypothetical protein [bacterium]